MAETIEAVDSWTANPTLLVSYNGGRFYRFRLRVDVNNAVETKARNFSHLSGQDKDGQTGVHQY